jgi:hypothetical protein
LISAAKINKSAVTALFSTSHKLHFCFTSSERHHKLVQLVGCALSFKHSGEEALTGIGCGLLCAMEDI